MSAFLGPIHNWLYGKILLQNELVHSIEEVAKKNNWLDDTYKSNRYGELEQGALEDIVDESNIHGWLQERVSLVENRLAYLITMITADHPEYITEITEVVMGFGKKYAPKEPMNAQELYRYLDSLLLNGMPCDGVNAVLKQEEDSVIWHQTIDIHRQYWDLVDGNIEFFYIIRDALVTGILEESGYEFVSDGDTNYELKRII